MANQTVQLSQVISKLYKKTASGDQPWKPSLMNGKYQARFGDFTVEISGGLNTGNKDSILHSDASIEITKLNGDLVATAGGGSGIARGLAVSLTSRNALDNISQDLLNKLYRLVSDRSEDLDELLKLI